MVIFGTDQEGNGRLVEPATLSVPLLDRVQCAFAREIEHEQNCDSIVAHEGKHVDEFTLATQIPNRKRNLRIPNGDSLLHEVDALTSRSALSFLTTHESAAYRESGYNPHPNYPRHILPSNWFFRSEHLRPFPP